MRSSGVHYAADSVEFKLVSLSAHTDTHYKVGINVLTSRLLDLLCVLQCNSENIEGVQRITKDITKSILGFAGLKDPSMAQHDEVAAASEKDSDATKIAYMDALSATKQGFKSLDEIVSSLNTISQEINEGLAANADTV